MSEKLTATKLKMAALGLNMKELGEKIYMDNPRKQSPANSVKKEQK